MGRDAGEPFPLPERWVHCEEPPAWPDLADAAVAFVGWRLDRWRTLEALHRLDRAARELDGAALVAGLHPDPGPEVPARRVRNALLARGAWAPTGLVESPREGVPEPGEVALVADGRVRDRFDARAGLDAARAGLADAAPEGRERWRPRGAAPGPWPLAFANDVAVAGSRLAAADTGHNRVLVARPTGEILQTAGEGAPGLRDGAPDQARFEAPRGVCWRGDELVVADTGNDAVRSLGPGGDEVRTLAWADHHALPAAAAADPEGGLYVALAGAGHLARVEDGNLAPVETGPALGHPVDVVAGPEGLVVADLDGARVVRLAGDGDVAWAGEPLVEPAGLLPTDAGLLVADPGAGAVFELDPDGGRPRHLLDVPEGPQEPSALAPVADETVVADGGGHHLWSLDADGGLARLRVSEPPLSLAEHIRLDPVEMAPGARLTLRVSYLPGDRWTPGDEAELGVPRASGPLTELAVVEAPGLAEGRVRATIEGRVAASGNLRVRWKPTRGGAGPETAWDVPVVVRPGADERLRLELSTSPP